MKKLGPRVATTTGVQLGGLRLLRRRRRLRRPRRGRAGGGPAARGGLGGQDRRRCALLRYPGVDSGDHPAHQQRHQHDRQEGRKQCFEPENRRCFAGVADQVGDQPLLEEKGHSVGQGQQQHHQGDQPTPARAQLVRGRSACRDLFRQHRRPPPSRVGLGRLGRRHRPAGSRRPALPASARSRCQSSRPWLS